MIRVFVYEYTCAAPPASVEAGGAASLGPEGDAMLRAVLEDFQRIPGVEAFTIRHARDEEAEFRKAARRADWSLVIAPEFDNILLTRCRWVLEEGGRLLGPSPEAVELCADKLALANWWHEHGVLTPVTEVFEPSLGGRCGGGSKILKPRFGAGAQDTLRLSGWDFASVEEFPEKAMVLQEFVLGAAASVAFLKGPARCFALRSASQHLYAEDQFAYLGGRVPLPPELEMRAQLIAAKAIESVPGLFGYFGVDVVLGDDGRDWAIEINPRLTTSYIGLRELAETNLAEAMLAVAAGREPDLRWRDGAVEFTSDGQIRLDFPKNENARNRK